jgi:hypothetical protein
MFPEIELSPLMTTQRNRLNELRSCEISPEMVIAGSDAVSEFWTTITDPRSDLSVIPAMVTAIYKAMEAESTKPR